MNRVKRSKRANLTERIELFPRGIIVHPGTQRPVLLMRSTEDVHTLPVCLSPLDAGLGLSALAESESASPHFVAWSLLRKLGAVALDCEFVRVKGHHQFVRLSLESNSAREVQKSKESRQVDLECRAEAAMSFCLSARARFWARVEVIEQSRQLNEEMDEISLRLRSARNEMHGLSFSADEKKTGYLM